jgi:hypothetical protein
MSDAHSRLFWDKQAERYRDMPAYLQPLSHCAECEKAFKLALRRARQRKRDAQAARESAGTFPRNAGGPA